MRKLSLYMVALVTAWGALAHQGDADQPAVIIRHYDNLTPLALEDFDHLETGDLAIFDLDNTVFRETQMLGTDEWYEEMLFQLERPGGPFSSKEELHAVNDRIKRSSQMKLMETETPILIQKLQDRGVLTIGLTARHPDLASPTVAWLNRFGIDFSRRSFSDKRFRFWRDMGINRKFLFSDGIAFVDGAPKGLVLQAILDFVAYRPKRAVAVDDRIKHVNGFVDAMLDYGIKGYVIHYVKVREEPAFRADLAELQLAFFQLTGYIPSDQEAEHYLILHDACETALVKKP